MEYHIMLNDDNVSDRKLTHSWCDRRVSRAAREIVREALQRAVAQMAAYYNDATNASPSQKHHQEIQYHDLDVSDWNVWQLLEEMIPKKEYGNENYCPLYHGRDILRVQEEATIVLQRQAVVSRSTARQWHNSIPGYFHHDKKLKHNPFFYKCRICGKIFTSRYYLDHHFELQHTLLPSKVGTTKSDYAHHHDIICSATEWCTHFLLNCHERALLMEPYYGPGSAGYGHDRYMIQNQLIRQTHNRPPCTSATLLEFAMACQAMIQDCFGNSHIATFVNQTLCTQQTCHTRLVQLLPGESWSLQDWQDIWVAQEQHHLGIVGVLVASLLLCYYTVQYYYHRRMICKDSVQRQLRRHIDPSHTLPPRFPPTTHTKQI